MTKRLIYVLQLILLYLPLAAGSQNLINGPDCVTYDAANDRYFVSNYFEGKIVAIASDGTQSYFAQNLTITNATHIVGNTLYATSGYNYIDAWDLTSGTRLWRRYIIGSDQVDGITSDNSGHLYVTSYSGGPGTLGDNRIIKFNISDLTSQLYVTEGLDDGPQDLYFDEPNNRLLVTFYDSPGRIMAVDLTDASLSTVVTIPYPLNNGIERDNDGNWYVTCYWQGLVYKYDSDFANPPVQISSGHQGPTALGYNPVDNILAVPNFLGSTVSFIPLEDNDNDDVLDFRDNCPNVPNTDQTDSDGDGDGDVCDGCPFNYNPGHEDSDADGIEDACDNCPEHYNPGQEDSNSNNVGDLCDYVCGDIDGSPGINILDIVFLINNIYKSGPDPDPLESADVNHDLVINILDIVYLINNVYKAGADPECVVWG